ncbi:hypothetical protein QBC47DRAFT_395167 [Echria macrotheca]|uniref:PLL-like beta propeller domain-containing protein n=1 Tax=Echria macrotheca TaxID=438768 RepID=A0AAJ0B5R1_9PEZI|nr:hypothetical protein QBC47DRAFT_395167 [Echria macrotheca]
MEPPRPTDPESAPLPQSPDSGTPDTLQPAGHATLEVVVEEGSPRPQLPIEHDPPGYSALQVVYAEQEKVTSAEARVCDDNSPQVFYDDNRPEVFDNPDKFLAIEDAEGLEVGQSEGDVLPEAVVTTPKPVPWYKDWKSRPFWVLAVIVVAVITVAVVVGAVVGIRNTSRSSRPGSSATRQSACAGTICPQILTASVLGLNTSADNEKKVFIFARGDGALYFNWAQVDTITSDSGWPAGRTWQPLLGGGPFISQPMAISWTAGARLTVAAVIIDESKNNQDFVAGNTFHVDANGLNGFSIDDWKPLGGPVGSSLISCTLNSTRADYYAVGGTKMLQNLSFRNGTPDMWKHPDQLGIDEWDLGYEFGYKVKTRPAVLCRPSFWVHDMITYDDKGAVRHAMWGFQINSSWSDLYNLGGNFTGEPTAVATGSDRLDFFGIGANDSAMYHFTWTQTDNYTALQSLGGSFHSAASAVVTEQGSLPASRIDVVALGIDDHIHHRVMKGTEWVLDWEDLGVVGNSAPLVFNYGSVAPERVGVFVVGYDGSVNHATWTVSSEPSWKNLTWKSMQGDMLTEFYNIV